jgi:4-carboxymuconolactone decarboxylase
VPIELAFGALVVEQGKSGCDLRPSDPRLGLPPVACHAGEASSEPYYQPGDLAKFAEIGQSRPELAEKFFAWYSAVFADGALSTREKSLIALAVAHAVQCPYCIDAYSHDAQKKGASLDQMTEAVHVAAAIRGGASLVHGVQMRNHVGH